MNDKDDMFMSGDDGSYIGGSGPGCLRFTTLKVYEVEDHLINMAQLIIIDDPNEVDSVDFINGCEKRFVHTFGEPE